MSETTYGENGKTEYRDDYSYNHYIYDKNGNRIKELAPDERKREYQYDTENRLIAVRDELGLLMSALHDGDDNRAFRANRTTKTATCELSYLNLSGGVTKNLQKKLLSKTPVDHIEQERERATKNLIPL